MLKHRFVGVLLLVVLSLGQAQTPTHVELVLDASGSMWNKLADGQYRIVAAKAVLADFVSSLPADETLNVGLRVYGSRTAALDEGSCEDSELFVPIDGVARDALLASVRDANAVGATPIAYSLQQAAADFPAQGKKIIVLVTDGEESCGGDVRGTLQTLRDSGVEIDLKVIGFDLNDRAVSSFEGLGTFENARSAGELAAALGRAVTVEKTQTYPVAVNVTRQGEPAADGAAVKLLEAVGGEAFSLTPSEPGTLTAEVPAGAYTAEVEDAFTDTPLSFSGLSVTPEGDNAFAFELAAETEVVLSVTPAAPVTGSTVTVTFGGAPPGARNWVTVVPQDVPDEVYLDYEYVTDESGTAELRLPAEAATLEARYHVELPEGGTRVVGRSAPFASVQATVTLDLPAEVAGGTAFDVAWTGPDNERDYLTVVPADAPDGQYQQYRYTRENSTLQFTAPVEPGDYEVRYQSDYGDEVVARAPFTVTASAITLDVPAEVAAGTSFDVAWTGPNGNRDYLTVVPADAADDTYQEYSYTSEGPTLDFTAPITPGRYEVRYQSDRERGVFARQAFTVTETAVRLDAPAEVGAGEAFTVTWSGPDGAQDYVTIVPAGAAEGVYLDYAYTRGGTSLTLDAPAEPGSYEIRYSTDRGSDKGKIFASVPITVR